MLSACTNVAWNRRAPSGHQLTPWLPHSERVDLIEDVLPRLEQPCCADSTFPVRKSGRKCSESRRHQISPRPTLLAAPVLTSSFVNSSASAMLAKPLAALE